MQTTLKCKAKEEHYTIAETVAILQDGHPDTFRAITQRAAAVYLELYRTTEPNQHSDSGDLLQGRAACWPMYRDRYTPEQTQALKVVSLCCLVDALLTRKRTLPDALPFVVLTRTLLYCGDKAGYTLPMLSAGIDLLSTELESAAVADAMTGGGGIEPKTPKTLKEPTKEQRIAYQLTRAQGMKQADAAALMTKERYTTTGGGKIGQDTVSRWAAAFADWLELQGLPTEDAAPKAGKTLVNDAAFTSGARTDGRTPHRKAD